MDAKVLLNQVSEIQNKVREYLTEHNIKALIIGISGGFDSGFNAAILKLVCDELSIPLIGAWIHIESNKKEEEERAFAIGKVFCSFFLNYDLTSEYSILNNKLNETLSKKDKDKCYKHELIQMGNIKARLRMITLYNLASKFGGIVVDNDNKSEYLTGFMTLNGDVGDITPLASFYKTELYEMAKAYLKVLKTDEEKNALRAVIDAVPTDGLGITSSDLEQMGVPSYFEVDNVLRWIEDHPNEPCPYEEGSGEAKVWQRWKNSEFKRHHPYRVFI